MKKMFAQMMATAMACAMLLTSCGQGGDASTPSTSTPSTSTGDQSVVTDIEWPEQPVNIICPASAGGGTDLILRTVNEYFTGMTGQPFVINNITGLTGYEQIHQGNTDGYDFIFGTTTIFTSKLDGTLDYDWTDYEMVAFIEGDYNTVIAVQADSPYQNINDLLDAARSDPSSVTGGITLSGQPYMFSKALADAVGIDLYYVDCGTTAERNTALLGGQVDFIITNTLSSQAYVESGDFRFIAIDGDERFELAPDVPTFKEQGVDFTFAAQPMVVLAPKGTPAEVCEAINSILNQIYTNEEFVAAYRDTLSMIARPVPSIEESIQLGEEFATILAPYV